MSYVIFLYADGLIQWTSSDATGGVDGLGGNEARIGITSGDGVNFITYDYSSTLQLLNIVSSRVPDRVTVGGMLMYRADGGSDPNSK